MIVKEKGQISIGWDEWQGLMGLLSRIYEIRDFRVEIYFLETGISIAGKLVSDKRKP